MTRRSGIPLQRRYSARLQDLSGGFTLVELMVAIMVMTIGILGLASTAGVVTRMMSSGARQTIAANLVAARFEKFRNRLCTSVTAGSATTRSVTETWTVSAAGSNMKLVVDSVSFRALSRHSSNTRAYRSYVPCR